MSYSPRPAVKLAGGIYDGVIKLFLNEDGSLPNIRTVQHELIHATLERNFPNRAPMWFEEGLAELFEHPRQAD